MLGGELKREEVEALVAETLPRVVEAAKAVAAD